MRSRFVSAVAMASALVALAGLGTAAAWRANGWNMPTSQKLRVATPPLSDGGKKFFNALKVEVAAQHAPIQLSLVEIADVGAIAQALKEQKVDEGSNEARRQRRKNLHHLTAANCRSYLYI